MDTTSLPALLATYFTAATKDNHDALLGCFTEHAVIVDDGRVHVGQDAIRRWHHGESTTWTYTSELTAAEPVGRTGHHVAVHVEGNFPGGVVDLHYQFLVADGRILSLTIAP